MERTGIVITTYNRPHYLKKCLDSLKSSFIFEDTIIVIVDDCSINQNTIDLINAFKIEGVEIFKILGTDNKGVWKRLQEGFDFLIEQECKVLCNIDSDAIVNNHWQLKLEQCYSVNKDKIISGFNAMNSARFDKGVEFENYFEKEIVCGLNLYFNKSLYKYVIESFNSCELWDIHLPTIIKKAKKKFIVTKPSVMQHIGFESSMNHTATPRALDFI